MAEEEALSLPLPLLVSRGHVEGGAALRFEAPLATAAVRALARHGDRFWPVLGGAVPARASTTAWSDQLTGCGNEDRRWV